MAEFLRRDILFPTRNGRYEFIIVFFLLRANPRSTAGAAQAASTAGRYRRQFRRLCALFRSTGRRHSRRSSQGTRQSRTGGQSGRRRAQNTSYRRRGELFSRTRISLCKTSPSPQLSVIPPLFIIAFLHIPAFLPIPASLPNTRPDEIKNGDQIPVFIRRLPPRQQARNSVLRQKLAHSEEGIHSSFGSAVLSFLSFSLTH